MARASMKFKDLSSRWRRTIIIAAALGLLLTGGLGIYVFATVGSLIGVMS